MAMNDHLTVISPFRFSHFNPDIDSIFRIYEPIIQSSPLTVFPGLCDVHVHFREPGFSYKETIASGSRAAAHGGFTDVCAMPNLNPVPDSCEHLAEEEAIIARDAVIRVHPYASITCDEAGKKLADIEALGERVIGFSDDGKGVQGDELMYEAMRRIAAAKKPIATHCEIEELKADGYINAGSYASAHGHRGIPKEAEWKQIERDIELARLTGVTYHICHISCAESVALVRAAKAAGINVTCETAPHYLLIDDSMLQEDGHFKMNPPLRSPEDREALIEALVDGTIDIIATDHAPHSAEEKSLGLADSAFGIVGIETSFQLMYTEFVCTGMISFERLLDLMAFNPRERFGIAPGGKNADGSEDFTVWDLNWHGKIDPEDFISMGSAQPFTGRTVCGRCVLTVCDGRVAYAAPELQIPVGTLLADIKLLGIGQSHTRQSHSVQPYTVQLGESQ